MVECKRRGTSFVLCLNLASGSCIGNHQLIFKYLHGVSEWRILWNVGNRDKATR